MVGQIWWDRHGGAVWWDRFGGNGDLLLLIVVSLGVGLKVRG